MGQSRGHLTARAVSARVSFIPLGWARVPLNEDRDRTPPSASADADLLAAMQAFQRGDRAAFGRVYEALWPAVRRRASKMALGAEESEEIAQKVLVRVYLYAAQAGFDTKEHLWAWVYTIAGREIYKHWRQRRPQAFSQEALDFLLTQPTPSGDDPANRAADAEEVRDVGECIGRLEGAERLHLLGPLLQHLTFRQAAALHSLSLGQFKHRYEKALQKVRDCMKAKGHDLE